MTPVRPSQPPDCRGRQAGIADPYAFTALISGRLREQMRVELVGLQRDVGITSIYVTHDQAEALVMSDRVVVMDRGVIQQVADPRTIYARPANAFVARFIGVTNLLPGTLLNGNCGACTVEVDPGAGLPPLRLHASGSANIARRARVVISVRPEDITLHGEPPAQSSEINVVEGHVRDAFYLGRFHECIVELGLLELNVQVGGDPQLVRGQPVLLNFRADHSLCIPD